MKKRIITALTCILITFSTSVTPAFAMAGDGTVFVYDPTNGDVYIMSKYDMARNGTTVEAYCARYGYLYVDTTTAKTPEEQDAMEVAFKAEHPDAHYADLGFYHDPNHTRIAADFGEKEAPDFDPAYYAAANPDVIAVYGTDDAYVLYRHYVKYGKAEGRLPRAGAVASASTVQTMSDGTKFDPAYYAAANPDVVAAFGTSTNALYNHYVKCGKAEGRLPYAK